MRVCCGFGCPVLARLLFRCSCSSPHRVTTAQAAEWSQWHWQQAWACTAMRIERNGRIAHCLKSEYSKRIPLAGKVGPVEPSGKNFEPVVWLLLKASWSSYELWPSPAPCCVGVKLWLLLDSKPTAIILYGYPQIIHFRWGIFHYIHYKPSILRYPHLWKPRLYLCISKHSDALCSSAPFCFRNRASSEDVLHQRDLQEVGESQAGTYWLYGLPEMGDPQ